jgi:hypothetical protein
VARIIVVVEAIAELLRATDGDLTAYTEPVGSVDTPAAIVTLGPGDPESSMSGDSRDRQFIIDWFLTMGPQGMENLYEYLDDEGGKSLILLFNRGQDLDGVVDYAVLSNWDTPDRVEMANGEFYHVRTYVDVGMS